MMQFWSLYDLEYMEIIMAVEKFDEVQLGVNV